MTATTSMWNKHMKKFFRSPEAAFGMLLQPILWVALFGIGMQGMVSMGTGQMDLSQVFGGSYIAFMVPGIIAFSALSGAVAGGATLLDERLRGIVKEYLAAPIPRYSILLANALSTVTKGLFQSIVIIVVAIFLGAHLSGNPLGWLAGLASISLYGLGIAGLALAVAARVNSTMGYHGLIALDLPLLFASNALYPLDVLPRWMQWVARVNPTTYTIDTLRSMTYGITYSGQANNWLSFGVLIAFAVMGIALATRAFGAVVKQRGGAA